AEDGIRDRHVTGVQTCALPISEAGIDLWSFAMLVEEFQKLHTEKKESLLLISHQERIIQMADRVMIIDGGQVTKCGPTQEILPRSEERRVGNERTASEAPYGKR